MRERCFEWPKYFGSPPSPSQPSTTLPSSTSSHYPSMSIDPIESARIGIERKKNRLIFFRGIHCLSVPLFEEAGKLLVDSPSHLYWDCFYYLSHCVKCAMIAACLTFQRPALKKVVPLSGSDGGGWQVAQFRELLLSFYRVSIQFSRHCMKSSRVFKVIGYWNNMYVSSQRNFVSVPMNKPSVHTAVLLWHPFTDHVISPLHAIEADLTNTLQQDFCHVWSIKWLESSLTMQQTGGMHCTETL